MITIPGELCDLNTYIKAERTKGYGMIMASNIKKAETGKVILIAKLNKFKIITPAIIKFAWYTKDLRKDADNVGFAKKFLLDGLVLAGSLPDDTRRYVVGFTDSFFVDSANPRVEVSFETVV